MIAGANAARLLAICLVASVAGCPNRSEHSEPKSAKRLAICRDFFQKNELEGAEAECTKAINYWPKNDEALVTRGLISMMRAGAAKRSMEVDDCLTGLDAEATDKDLQAHLAKAELDFEQASKVNPEYGEAWANRGIVANLVEDYANAVVYLTKALENPTRLMNPALTRAHLGWALFHQAKHVEATKELRSALSFQPKQCVATYRLGRVYFAREEWEKAAEAFQTVSEDPSCKLQESSYYLMKTRMQQGLKDEARSALASCTKLSPKSCIATKCRADGGSL